MFLMLRKNTKLRTSTVLAFRVEMTMQKKMLKLQKKRKRKRSQEFY